MLIFGFLAESSPSRKRFSAGYTLMEVAVSISIIIMIILIAVGYSRNIDTHLALLGAQTQIVAMISHTKGLTQNFLLVPPAGKQICGYGVHIERNPGQPLPRGSFQAFQDLVPAGGDCATVANNRYDDPGEKLQGSLNYYQFDTNILDFDNSNPGLAQMTDVVFIPPDINANMLDTGGALITGGPGSISVRIKLSSSAFTAQVSGFGQITVK